MVQGQVALLEKVFERFCGPTATLTKGLHINIQRAVTKAKYAA